MSLWGDETRDQRRGDRSPLECYRDFMADFAREFAPFLRRRPGSSDGPVINQVIIGLGPCGELRYPSYRATSGGTFQASASFRRTTNARACRWRTRRRRSGNQSGVDTRRRTGPSYNCDPEVAFSEPPRSLLAGEDEPDAKRRHTMTVSASDSSLASASFSHAPASSSRGFFATDGTGTWNTARGRFFLSWYSQELVQHGERVGTRRTRVCRPADAALGIKCGRALVARSSQSSGGVYGWILQRRADDVERSERREHHGVPPSRVLANHRVIAPGSTSSSRLRASRCATPSTRLGTSVRPRDCYRKFSERRTRREWSSTVRTPWLDSQRSLCTNITHLRPRRRGSASHFGERQQLFARISQLDVER